MMHFAPFRFKLCNNSFQMRCIAFSRALGFALATVCVVLAHGSTKPPNSPVCNFLLGAHHPFSTLISQAYLNGAFPLGKLHELAHSEEPFNPVRQKESPFYRGIQMALQRRELARDWLLIAAELRELHSMWSRPTELDVKEIYRVRSAESVSAPILTEDRSGRLLMAFQSRDGRIKVYRVGDTPVEPAWIFPRHDLPLPNDAQFVHLAWHPDKDGGDPWLFAYWLPINDDNDDHPAPALHRAAARFGSVSAEHLEVAVPKDGFVEAVQSFGFGNEFYLFTPVSDEEPRLMDMNEPERPGLNMGMPPAPGLFTLSQTGVPLLVRLERDDVQVMQRTKNAWRTIWSERCPVECMEASIYRSSSGEVWVSYTDGVHRLTVQSIHRAENRINKRLGNPILEPPKFFESQEGHLYTLVEAQSGSLITVPVSGPAAGEGAAAIEFPDLSYFFLNSSRVFKSGSSNRVFLGLISVNGLRVMNPLGGPLSPMLAKVAFEGSEQVGWWEGREQTYMVVGSNPRQRQLVVYRMLARP